MAPPVNMLDESLVMRHSASRRSRTEFDQLFYILPKTSKLTRLQLTFYYTLCTLLLTVEFNPGVLYFSPTDLITSL